MPAVNAPAKVMVTGASGFVAAWVIKNLLDEGYVVRGTLRSIGKAKHYNNIFKKEVEEARLEFVEVPDMSVKGAFDAAVRDMDAILHIASPVTVHVDDPDELIKPAVNGTLNILESARRAGTQLKRIGITSSCAAIIEETRPGLQDESSWNESNVAEVREKWREARPIAKYRTSKTLAEKAAWDFFENHKEESSWDLVTYEMPWVFGPVLQEVSSPSKLNESMINFYDRVFGKAPHKVEFATEGSWVDVRDVAHGHVQSLQVPEAGGKRFIFSAGEYIWQDWFDVVNELEVPGLDTQTGEPGAGKNFNYKIRFSNDRSRNMLGLQYRDKISTARDIVADFKSHGWIL